MSEETLIKGGEAVVRVSLRRSQNGHSISIWAHSAIENYFKQLAETQNPQTVAASQFGRNWIKRKGSGSLEVYNIPNLPAISEIPRGGYYDLVHVGDKIWKDEAEIGYRGGIINLSILRLVGVSQDGGITFDFRHVGTDEALQEMAKKIRDAATAFYINYLRPVDVTVTVSIQQTNG